MPGYQNEQPSARTGTAWPSGRPPFRPDHVGSLLRPPEVLRAREDLAAGRLGADRLREIEDAAIREVVRMQQEVGLRSATDGELRRESVAAVRLLLHQGGQRPQPAAAVGQAEADRRDRAGGLGAVVILAADRPWGKAMT